MSKHLLKILVFVLMLTSAGIIGQSQTTGSTAAGPTALATPAPLKIEKKRTLWDTIVLGGWAMWPLGACSFALVAFTVLNFQRVNRKQMIPEGVISQMKTLARTGDYKQMLNTASATDSFFTRSLVAGLNKIKPNDLAGSMPKVEAAIGEAVSREETKYGYWINFLSLITGMAPMWGLLGTISGMIGAFDKIGAGGMGKPELLASNIGEALITTATGLLVAIPAMISYFLFRNLLSSVMKDSEHHFSDILDAIMETSDASETEAT
ncbi:MAG: MotA/TolQ/ExbB proton channel family protein [Kiritimatiellae bacterium]|nr:MotA/TolQ/ExbB proton channel family protein [Verrucomicrobiota bacterium]MCG2680323.1 MotA/TolQ/ExbB proton channel family protein [Kiritimatiellia bacterium]